MRKMNYWMTTHWPPHEDEDLDNYISSGIWLPDGRQQAGSELEIGDRVLIYESKTGRSEIVNIKGKLKTLRSTIGKEGIVVIAEVTSDLYERIGSKPSQYTTGDKIWWRWKAETEPVTTNGFVPRTKVNEVLGYKPGNSLHGFGDYHSGLKRISRETYEKLVAIFLTNPRKIDIVRKAQKSGGWGSTGANGGESEEHEELKNYVASNPSTILGEFGLKTIKTEYTFPCGDRADIALIDADGRVIGAEIEIQVNEHNLAGVLQAIKYRYMLALMEERKYFETRSFLIAKYISPRVQELCRQYDVECFVIKLNTI